MITPNRDFTNNGTPAGPSAGSHSNAWGGTVGAGIEHALTPAWSVGLEYDYYRFAATSVSVPATLNFNGGAGAPVAGNRANVTPDMQVVKLALNYHWDQDPRIAWADSPVFGASVMPLKARPAPALFTGWEVDAGGRYWYSSGSQKNTSGTGALTSQLVYGNLTGQSGEFFVRVDTPTRLFVKGFFGSGGLNGGKDTDEDWGSAAGGAVGGPSGFLVSNGTSSGWFNYAVGDVGYDVLHERNYKFGPFVGYSYLRQNANAYGCTEVQPTVASCVNAGDNPNRATLTEDETWQSLRVGVSAVATIWDRWGINGDIAYLPYGQYSGLDSHWQRSPVAFYPQSGTSRGVQAELVLTYLVTDNLELGVGGRYWAMWIGRRQTELPWRLRSDELTRPIRRRSRRSVHRQYRALRYVRASELPVPSAFLIERGDAGLARSIEAENDHARHSMLAASAGSGHAGGRCASQRPASVAANNSSIAALTAAGSSLVMV